MEYFPDQTLEQCHEALDTLISDAKAISREMAVEEDGPLAEMLTIMLISSNTQMMVLWHMMARLEKKIDALNSSGNIKHKRFDVN